MTTTEQRIRKIADIRFVVVQVLSGPGGTVDNWYVGFIEGETADTIIIAVLEENQNLADVVEIGRAMGTAVNTTTAN